MLKKITVKRQKFKQSLIIGYMTLEQVIYKYC